MTLLDAPPRIRANHLEVVTGSVTRRLHHVWLRDQCGCGECRVEQSGERKLVTAEIPDDLMAVAASLDAGGDLHVTWSDGHRSAYAAAWLERFDVATAIDRSPEVRRWDGSFEPGRFPHEGLLDDPAVELAYLEAVVRDGVAIVTGVPSRSGEAERFAERIGHVRETAFQRVHDVRHDPSGYNVAHTAERLRPHTDLPSYHWPPSIQLLHFLVNDATGGESVVVDGWHALARLRADDPEAFDTLVRTPVGFQLFSATEDTAASAPLVQLDARGEVRQFRFSNQLAQPLVADLESTDRFYRAYRALGRLIDDPAAAVEFRSEAGDLLTVHGHRVLHGRQAFDPASGARHLQDVYMEFDDLAARARVLRGAHLPLSSLPSADPAAGAARMVG